jgi:glycosyltransferase involved in cell wall biosynthesis
VSGAGSGLRIAAIMDTAILSGPGRQLTEVARALKHKGVDVTVVTFQRRGRAASPFPEHLAKAGVACEVLPESGATDVSLLPRLRVAIDRIDPHVIQTHSYKPAALVAAMQLLGRRRPWAAFFHGVTHEDRKVRVYNWIDRRLVARADRIVVMSQAQLAGFDHLGDRVRLVHNAVLTSAIRDGAADRLSLPESPRPVLGVIGRLSAEKGIDVLLRAVALLRDRGVNASLLVAGDGPERNALMRLRDDLGLTDSVHFLGPVHPIAALYPHLDVVVLSSRTEGLPNVLLEALAADRAVVATRVGAIPEVLSEPDAGALVEPDSVNDLADAIIRALSRLDDPRAREARRRAVDAFSLDRRAEAHVALYRELVGAASRAA